MTASVAAPSSQRSPTRSHTRSEEHTSELQSPCNLVCRLLLDKTEKRQLRPRRSGLLPADRQATAPEELLRGRNPGLERVRFPPSPDSRRVDRLCSTDGLAEMQ